MFKRFILIVLVASCSGCAVLSKSGHGQPQGPVNGTAVRAPARGSSAAARQAQAARKTPAVGVVFGKTDLRGLLKTAYARLTIVDQADPSRVYHFYVGDRGQQNIVPWGKGGVIEPGYFFIQLPPGKYEMTAIAIPVGSTVAEEALALGLEVAVDRMFYLGTLEVDGIKERPKFGGVPLVKPGFEYTLDVKDEFDAARNDLERLLPRHDVPVEKKLFNVPSSQK